ncbi:MAG: FtsH protease activity modulator HflK [Neptuniibacter sp.]
MAWNEPGGNGNNQDPWGSGDNNRGGKGGGDQGPPDLDEALRNLQNKLNKIFGGSGKKSSGGGSSGSSSGAGFFWVVVVIAVLVWGGMGIYTVDQQEQGVVLRLGKYSETVGPGLQWNPPLVDIVETVNVTRVRTRDHRGLMLTKDENIVDVEMTVQYVISDAKGFALTVRDPEASLSHAAESALRHVVGSTDMHSILTQGREALSVQVQARLQDYMKEYGTGLQISKVNIKEAKAPNQVQDAFDDVIKAREDEQRVKNEAESYANGIVPEARGLAQRMLEEASAYREQVVARSEGDAKRFVALLHEYEKAPEVTRERLYLDTMQEVLSKNSKVLVDVEGGNNMMYLPLDKIMQNRPNNIGSDSAVRLDSQSLREVTDQVVDQIRQRQSTRREGR